ncbi:MAG: TraB/GumN family protein [Polyangia bacterium]
MRLAFGALVTRALVSTAWAESPMFAEQPGTRGILYSVHKAGSPMLYLFGTIHVSTSTQTPFSHAVKTALAQCKRVALEADPSDIAKAMGAMMQLGRYPAGDSLRKHVPRP